ncbi:MAG: DUF642 domain-containing protein [Oligoflexus sp.]
MARNVGSLAKDSTESSDQQETATKSNEPVMVAGGFLTCQISDDERWQAQRGQAEVIAVVDCHLSDAQSQPMSVDNPKSVEFKTFTQEGTLAAVEVASIVEVEGTHWILPMISYANPWLIIAELTDGQSFEAEIDASSLILPIDILSPIEFGPINSDGPAFSLGPEILINGSFDEPAVVDPQFSDDSKAWGHYAPAAVTGWQAQWNNNTCTNNVRVEVQRQFQNGNQFTDLAGSCQFGVTPPPGGSNLSLSQTLPTTAGAVYQLSFSYLIQNTESVAFRVEGPEGILFDTSNLETLEENVWQQISLQFTAEEATSRLHFSESGPDPLSGTLLDNVSVKEVRRKLIE